MVSSVVSGEEGRLSGRLCAKGGMAHIEKRGGRYGVRYRVRIRRKDLGEVSKTFVARSSAERWARKREIELEEEVHLGGGRQRTVGEAIDRYLERELRKLAESNWRNVERQLEWWRHRVGTLGLADGDRLHAQLVEGLDELLAGGRAPATVNRYRAVLARVFSLASGRWRWCRENPFSAIVKEREPRLRVRYLDPLSEKPALLRACRASRSRKLYPMVLTALVTGARQGSIKGLEWGRNVDLERRRILFTRTKNRNPVNARITDELLATLVAWRRESPYGERLVFGGTYSRWGFEYACVRAGVENFRFHDLRHTCASYLVMAGATPHEVMAQLGLLTLSQVMKYAHLAPNAADWVVEKVSREQYRQEEV